MIRRFIALVEKHEQLEKRITELERRERIKKHSSNSSNPPSQDKGKPKSKSNNKSLRSPSDKKPGGQPGHKGSNLKITATPNKIEEHRPAFCNGCGHDLSNASTKLNGRFQEIELPPIKVLVTEHRYYESKCSCCGKTTALQAPTTAHVRYGSRIEGIVAYLSSRQYVPYNRMTELLSDLLGFKLSQGTVDNMLDRFAKKASGVIDSIKANLSASKVVGSDETGIKVNGKQCAFWTWQDELNTLVVPAKGRGYEAVENNVGELLKESILVHDCWAAQLKTSAQKHQICLAHLLRDLNYLIELGPYAWPKKIHRLLLKAIDLKSQMQSIPTQSFKYQRSKIEKRLDRLLEECPTEGHREIKTLAKRLIKYRDHVFVFLYHQEVPFHNNASEQAIRNAKVKQKISGQFKSWKGAERFATIRSVIDTCIKRQVNILESLNLTAQITC